LLNSTTTTKTVAAATTTTSAAAGSHRQIGVDTPLNRRRAPGVLSEIHGVTLAADDFNTAGGLTIGIPTTP